MRRQKKLSSLLLNSARSATLWYSSAVARAHRISGERDLERAALNRAIDFAIHSKTSYCVGVALADATFSSWFWGEEELFEGYLARLEDNLTPSCELKFRFFIECARGRGTAARSWFEKMNIFSLTYLTYASLMAAAISDDAGAARRFAFEALAAADESNQGFVKIITRVALALLDSKRKDGLLADADRLANETQSPKLIEAIAALRSGSNGLGMLTHFVARFGNGYARSNSPTLNVSLISRKVTYADAELALSKRELELILFLGHQRQSISSQTIADAMWPGRDGALDALYVTVGRLRSRLPIEAVERQGDGYRLTRNVTIDLHKMEERYRAIEGHLPLSESQRVELSTICDRLYISPDDVMPWVWLEGIRARIDRLRNQVITILAQDAFERRSYHDALSLARTQLLRDECDETACEVAIRAALALKDQLTARSILQTYERSVKREIGTMPPTYLRQLVNGYISHAPSPMAVPLRLTQSA